MCPTLKLRFQRSLCKKIDGLNFKNVLSVVYEKYTPAGERVYGSRWVDATNTVDNTRSLKSRFVSQNYRDEGTTKIATKSPNCVKTWTTNCNRYLCYVSKLTEKYTGYYAGSYTILVRAGATYKHDSPYRNAFS